MKTITYGIFAEDAANQIFMKNVIPQLIEYFGIKNEIILEHEEDFTKFIIISSTPNIEGEKRKVMKKKVYNRQKPTNSKSNPIVESLSESFDINWLCQCSESFDHFVNEFEQYIENIKN